MLNALSRQSCIINVESVPAMERLDELLAVLDLDAVLVGPHDLSQPRHSRALRILA